jgi:hypothetical protein
MAVIPIPVLADSINLYAVVGQGWIANGSGIIANAPFRLTTGTNTITVTQVGTFTITMCSGTSAVVNDGTTSVDFSPLTCTQAAATTINTSGSPGSFTITVTYNSTANWSSQYSWSTTSGGIAGTHAVPTLSNNVYLDANTFTATGQTLTVSSSAVCNAMDCTGVLYNPTLYIAASTDVSAFGAVTLSNMTVSGGSQSSFYFRGNGTHALTTNGVSINCTYLRAYEGTTQLQDNLTVNNQIDVSNIGSLDTNSKTVSCSTFYIAGSSPKTVSLGASTVTCSAIYNHDAWIVTATNLTFPDNTSTINCNGNFVGGNVKKYNIVNLTMNPLPVMISGNNTIVTLAGSSAATQTFKFADGTSQTVTNLNMSGTSLHVHTLTGASTAGWTVSKASGTVSLDFVNIAYSTATGGATFNASGASVNMGNNTGWNFPLNVSTRAATDVSVDKDGIASATLNGAVTDMGGNGSDKTWFQYGLTSAYGSVTTAQTITAPQTFTNDGDYFTLAVIPDTQIYSRDSLANFETITNWIAANKTSQNIKFVVQVGDLVDNATVTDQWANAKTAMDILKTAGVPYCVLPGNHDYGDYPGSYANLTKYNTYFPVTDFNSSPYWGGNYNGNENSYFLITVDGMDYVILNIGFGAENSTGALTWANSVLNTYSNRRAIIDTHAYLDENGNELGGESALWTNFIAQHRNVFAVFSGHIWESFSLTKTGTYGNTVHILQFDMQEIRNGGDGDIRLYRFYPAANRIEVHTYSTMELTELTDVNNRFDISYQMTGGSALLTNLVPGQTYHYCAAADNGAATLSGSDQTFTFTLPGVTTGSASRNLTSVILNGSITDMGKASSAYVSFKWGYSPGLGSTTTPVAVTGAGAFTATLTGVDKTQIVYYQAVAATGGINAVGNVSNTLLQNLAVSSGTLIPGFSSGTGDYTDSVDNSVSSVKVTLTVNQPYDIVTVNGVSVTGSPPSQLVNLTVGLNIITVAVTAQDGGTKGIYTISVTRAAPPPNGGVPVSPTTAAGVINLESVVNSQGVFSQEINAWSADNKILLRILAGNTGLMSGGAPLTQISIIPEQTPPVSQPGTGLITPLYDFTPAGTTFSVPVTVRFSYDPALIPIGAAETGIRITYYDNTRGVYVVLPSTVDTANHFVSAQITGFSAYTVTCSVQAVTTTTATTAATTAMMTTKISAGTTTRIVIIAVLAVLAIGLLFFLIIKKRKKL